MKKIVSSLLISCLITLSSLAQNIQFALGPSYSTLDWQYVYFSGQTENFYTSGLYGTALDLGVEFLQKPKFSVSTNIGFFNSGGVIAENETHENWVITERENKLHNFSMSALFNYLPLNQKFQLAISAGPRLDLLVPHPNSIFDIANNDLNKLKVGINAAVSIFYNFENIKIGIRSTYLHRFNMLMDSNPSENEQWWQNPKLGIRAKDKFILSQQLVLGFKLGE